MGTAINQRQTAVTRARTSLEQVQATIAQQLPPAIFWTIDLQGRNSSIGEITGEELQNQCLTGFSARFCIGK